MSILGPTGRQIPDHSLELADLPLAGGEKRVLISNAAKEFEARELTIADVSGVAPTSHTHAQSQSHLSPDTDSAASALHHTLGAGANQAAAGNHTHSGYEPTISPKNTAFNVNFGTAAGTACQGNDSRLSDARTPVAHVLNSASHTVSGLTTGHFLKATGATTFGFAAHGLKATDVDAAPTSHTHGNITAAGAVGSTPNLPLVTTTGGTVTAGAWHAATPAAPTTTGSAGASNSPARGDHAHPSRIATSAPASPVNGDIWMV